MLPERFSNFARMVNAELELLVPPETIPPDPIHRAIRYSLFAGGKRLRPILCLASCESLNNNPEIVLPIAAAIEMVHTYSLVHDDLPCMDNDDFRRGKPTNHLVFGEAIAVLTGDSLLTMAMEVLSSSHYQPAIRSRLINMLTKAAGTYGMIGGQVLDMVSSNTTLTEQQLENLHSMKTAALIRFSCMATPVALESGTEVEDAFGEYGNFIGLAFQIVDDILDIEGTTETLGKTAGKDRKNEKVTYPSLIGIDKSRELAKDFIDRACKTILPHDRHHYLRTLALHILEREK
jgi:geranylgeranyl diphosphate synthase, type II